jgi:hypothetical protein
MQKILLSFSGSIQQYNKQNKDSKTHPNGTGIVLVLIVGGVERIEDDDLGLGLLRRGQEVRQALRGAEQMTGGTGIDKQVVIGSLAQDTAHGSEPAGELRDGQFELAHQHPARPHDREAEPVRARGQPQSEVGDQQRFAHLRFSAHEQDALGGSRPGSTRLGGR